MAVRIEPPGDGRSLREPRPVDVRIGVKARSLRTGPSAALAGLGRHSVVSEGLVYTIAIAAPMLSTLLVTPVVTRSLGAGDYGLVALGVSVYQIGAVLVALGLPAAVTRDALIEASGTRGSSGTVVVGSAAAIVLTLVAIVSAEHWRGMVLPAAGPSVMVPALVSAAGLAILTLCQSQLRALSRVRTFVGLAVASAVVPSSLGLAAILIGSAHASTYLAFLAVGQALVAGVALGIVVRRDRPSINWFDLRRAVRIGLPTVPHQLATGAIGGILVIIAGRSMGSVAAGQLQLALLLGTAPIVIIGAFNNAWAPQVYRLPSAERAPYISATAPMVAAMGGSLAIAVALLAPFALAIIAAPELATTSSAQAAAVVAAAGGLSVLYLASVHLVFASGRTGWLALTTPGALVLAMLSAGLVWMVAPKPGLWTLAIAFPVFHATQAMIAALLRRATGTRHLRLVTSLPAVAGSFGVCILVAIIEPTWPVRLFAAVLILGAAAVFVAIRNRRSRRPVELLS